MLTVAIKKQLADFTLEIDFAVDNNIIVLFGPSGAGKTTILRAIAGLVRPDAGRITCGDRVFFSAEERIFLPPQARHVGYMFQDFALFPHMNVRKNIWYGVREKDTAAAEMFGRLLELLRIGHLAERGVGRLSGGEKQRVALARALMTGPQVLLLDEPLSSLEAATRLELQAELRKLQEMWRIPFVLVTHDAAEAKAVGDSILFLDHGRQAGQPADWR